MKFLRNAKEYGQCLLELVDKSKFINICSYGIYAGLWQKENGKNGFFPNIVTKVLNRISKKKRKHKIIISYYVPTSCKDCGSKRNQVNYADRLTKHIKEWPDLNFYLVTNCHLKAVLCSNNKLIMGGFNPVSNSAWTDFSVYLKNSSIYDELNKQFSQALSQAVPATDKNMDKLLYLKSEKTDPNAAETDPPPF